MKTIDHFLKPHDFSEIRSFADVAEFVDEVNEVDGVVYPKICWYIPEMVLSQIHYKLAWIKGAPISNPISFMRLSPEGVPVPHQAHTDNSMGDYSFMLYLNLPEHCRGGTSVLTHKETGLQEAPVSEEDVAKLARDANIKHLWQVDEMVEMETNRAFIFNSKRIHRAEPIGGFGTTNKDARLVLTVFFS